MGQQIRPGDLPLLRDCHFFNLRRATLVVTAFYDRHMEAAGVTVQQFSVLRHIQALGPLSVTALSDAMGLERTTLSRNLALLDQRGLVAAQPSPGRRKLMALTPAGEETLGRALVCWQRAQESLESRLGRERMGQLEELLALLLAED